MRRLLALGLGCLASATASSEDLLTIFDQAVVNDPLVREAEYTRKATREAKKKLESRYAAAVGRLTRPGSPRAALARDRRS